VPPDWQKGFKLNPDESESRLVEIANGKFDWTLDFGFEYIKNGFIIGINGLGLALGYDFMR
jgi:hypothetical protein